MFKERLRDKAGIVLAFSFSNRIIGTVRLIQMKFGLTLTETLTEHYNIRHPKKNSGWEIGRLAIEPDFRDPQTLIECLSLTANWLDVNTEVRDIFASCSHSMSRLYRRFDFKTLEKDLKLPGTDKRYTEIYGYLPTVLERLNNAQQQMRRTCTS